MKRILSILLFAALMLNAVMTVAAEGTKFNDVPATAWYYSDVYDAVTLGIVNGKSDTTFAPNDNLTYSEAIKLAACMHQLYTDGAVTLAPSLRGKWYQSYVDYANENAIITKEYDYGETVTRIGYMEIFANALPSEALKTINYVGDNSIPDVPSSMENAASIYKLYRAGILTGVDTAHNCKPMSTITRCEVAAIITRMMNPEKRISFSMGEETPDMYELFEVVQQPKNIAYAEEGNVLQYTVKASGGKTPYTYTWGYRSRYNGFVEIETSEYAWGCNTNTLHMLFDIDNPYTDQIYCKVTDALGQTVSSDHIKMPEKAFVFRLDSVIKSDTEYTFVGHVDMGTIRVGETVAMYKTDDFVKNYGVVTNIQMFGKNLNEAKAGDNCGIIVKEANIIRDDSFFIDSLGTKLAERVTAMGSYGFKVPLLCEEINPGMTQLGDTVTLSVIVRGGTPPYTYEWQRSVSGGAYEKLSGARKYSANLNKLSVVTDEDEFAKDITYRCVVTDAAGNTCDDNCLYIIPTRYPYLTEQPQDVYADIGDQVTFSVRTRCTTASYRWYIKNDATGEWKMIDETDTWASGERSAVLTIDVAMADFVSHCEYRCVITNTQNSRFSITSDSAKIHPKSMYITANPTDTTAVHGTKAAFTVTAEGGKQPYTYQWQYTHPSMSGYIDITRIHTWATGANTNELSILVNEAELNSEYTFRCIVKDADGTQRSSKTACVVVASDPSVSTRPATPTPRDDTIVLLP